MPSNAAYIKKGAALDKTMRRSLQRFTVILINRLKRHTPHQPDWIGYSAVLFEMMIFAKS
ncbi:hypothetical protein AZE99_03545 [Sphingorhabdus sp. M41]|nr:hypothetical protein AZE99_03545 [Sphingorhabdus sp. M41]